MDAFLTPTQASHISEPVPAYPFTQEGSHWEGILLTAAGTVDVP